MLEDTAITQGPRHDSTAAYSITTALFDVDNTLIGNESPELPSERFRAAMKAAHGKIRVAIASARPLSKVKHILEYIEAEGLSILCNGAQIVNSNDGSVVTEWTVSTDTCSSIVQQLSTLGIAFWINDNGIDYFPSHTNANVFERQTDIWDKASQRIAVPDYKPFKPFVINASGVNIEQVKAIEDMVRSSGDENITSLIAHETKQPDGSMQYDIFVVHKLANKKDALAALAKLENISLDHMMAVGDGRNDAVLVGSAGVGVAMGNSAQETLDVATFIAPNREDDGAAIALEFALDNFTYKD